jgi:hypothetical protein
MKRRLPKLLLVLVLLAAGGFALHALHAHRAETRDRELAQLLAGPLLPGVPDTGKPLWNVTLFGAGEDLKPLQIQGFARDTLGADLVRQTPPPDDSFRVLTSWLVGVGTPTESRLFESLRADPDARAAWESVAGRAFLVVEGTAANLLPDNVRERSIFPLKSDGTGLRERLVSALDAESARADVSFAEERLTAGVIIVLSNGPLDEEPGRFRRAVGWCCDRLAFLPLDSLAEWAAEERTQPSDPVFPVECQILSLLIEEGQASPSRMNQSVSETLRQLALTMDASAPLAASLRALLAKHRPEALGLRHAPKEAPMVQQSAVVTVVFPDRFEKRTVPLADTRLRAFLLDLLRLLAAPPPASPTDLSPLPSRL